jgi:hypothetical protein
MSQPPPWEMQNQSQWQPPPTGKQPPWGQQSPQYPPPAGPPYPPPPLQYQTPTNGHPTQVIPPGPRGHRARSPRKPHRKRNVILAAIGGLLVIGAISKATKAINALDNSLP